MATENTPDMSTQRLHDLLRGIACPSDDHGNPWVPDLEGFRRALALDAVRLTLFGEEGRESRVHLAPETETCWPRPGDLRIPCQHGDSTVGILEVRLGQGQEMGDDRRWALEMVADRVALEAHHCALEQALSASTLEAEAIDLISREMTWGRNTETLLELVLRQAALLSRAAGGALYLRDDDGEALVLQASHPADLSTARPRIPFGRGIAGRVAQGGASLRVQGVGPDEDRGNPVTHHSHLAVPLINEGVVIGVLSLEASDSHPFTATHERILTVFAAQASKAIAAAQLIRNLREERNLRENILAATPNGVIAVDDEGRVVLINNAAQQFFASSEPLGTQHGKPIERYLPQREFLESLQRVLRGAAESETLELCQGDETRRRDYLVNIFRLRREGSWAATLLIRDLTEQRRFDDQVLRMGRVASLGQLAAGIAHEIRNPLTGVSITLDILREEEGLSAGGQEMINDIGREIDRLEALVHGLLDFARPQPAKHRPMRLAKALDWHRTFREQCRNKGLEFLLQLEENAKLQGDPERLKQLFLNLAINALDATEPGGRVTVRAGTIAVPGQPPRVRVEVSDTGRGMDEPTRQQIFDPFFTTKNDGTGLGLSIAHSIAEQHGGQIEVDSAPGSGTTFRVELPTYQEDEGD